MNKISHFSVPSSFELANLCVGVKSESDWNISLFCTNLANNHPAVENMTALNLANPDFNRVLTSQPRTIGLDFNIKR